MSIMRFDPFRELDRLGQLLAAQAEPRKAQISHSDASSGERTIETGGSSDSSSE